MEQGGVNRGEVLKWEGARTHYFLLYDKGLTTDGSADRACDIECRPSFDLY